MSAVVGQPVGPGTKDIEPNECDWQYRQTPMPSIQVQINFQPGNTLADLCGPGDSALGLTVTTVSGVGDGACFEQLAGLGAGTNLTFSKGSGVYTIATVLGPDATADQIEAADKALALKALAHIGLRIRRSGRTPAAGQVAVQRASASTSARSMIEPVIFAQRPAGRAVRRESRQCVASSAIVCASVPP